MHKRKGKSRSLNKMNTHTYVTYNMANANKELSGKSYIIPL